MIWPFAFNVDYVFSYPASLLSVQTVSGWMLIAAACAGCVILFIKRKLCAALGTAWMIVTLLPVANIIPIYRPIAERYLYIPVIGYAVFLVALCVLIAGRLERAIGDDAGKVRLARRGMIALFGAACVTFAAVSITRSTVWKDERTLWEATVKDSPTSFKAHTNLGSAYSALGDNAGAEKEYALALAINPDDSNTHNNLGLVYFREKEPEKAEDEYGKALTMLSFTTTGDSFTGNEKRGCVR
jgi:tetratricopeptide (TPR) repeat protein